MATAKNKLPTFGASAETDQSIIDNSSGLKDTGFQPNTTIKSAEMNTYMKMLINGMSGLIDSVYNSGVSQGEIKADSSADDVKNYIVAGLNQIIKTNKVDNATHADKSTNVDNIANNDTGDNANVKFTIGDKSFSKTVNNVSHATNADNSTNATNVSIVDNGSTDDTIKFKIGSGTYSKTINNVANAKACSGNSATATKLATSRKISISGDASGSASFDGSGDATIAVDVSKSAALDSTNIGDSTHPVYFDASGKPVKIDKVANATNADSAGTAANCTGNSATASKLATARKIALSGDITGSTSFDGSGDATINTTIQNAKATQMVDSSSAALNIGNAYQPVYFSGGVPKAGNVDDTHTQIAFNYSGLASYKSLSQFLDKETTQHSPSTGYEVAFKGATALVSGGNDVHEGLDVGSNDLPVYFKDGVPVELTTTFFNIVANPFKSATLSSGRISLTSLHISPEHTIEVIYATSSSYSSGSQVSFGVISNKRLVIDENDATKIGIDDSGTIMRAIDTGDYLYIERATSISGATVSFSYASGIVYVRELASYK